MKGGRNNLALPNGSKRGGVPSNQGKANIGLTDRHHKAGKGKMGGRAKRSSGGMR